MTERRKYRFRAWHNIDCQMYPVIMVGRGGAVIQEAGVERTCPLAEIRLMQYSGINDAVGREIYEGDIVEFEHNGQIDRKHVSLENGSFRLVGVSSHGSGPRLLTKATSSKYKLQVVGNIFQLGTA